jgi:putative FmdB family regulatory protein
MPTYQYRCEKCGRSFERTETISEHAAVKPQCPKCGSKKVTFVPGRVFVLNATVEKSSGPEGTWVRITAAEQL